MNNKPLRLSLFLLFACYCCIGCAPLNKEYIGGYEVYSPLSKDRTFKDSARILAKTIASELSCKIDVEDDKTSPDTYCANMVALDGEYRIIIIWNRMSGLLSITFNKPGAEESSQILHAREYIDGLLKQQPDYKWTYSVTHFSLLR